MPSIADVSTVQRLLSQITASCSRHDWIKTLAAIKNALSDEGRSIAEDWSRTAPDLFDAADFDRAWNSLQVERGASSTATLGSLIHIAAKGHSGGAISTGEAGATEYIEPDEGSYQSLETARAKGSGTTPSAAPGPFQLAGEQAPKSKAELDKPNPRGKITERYKIHDWDGTHIATHLRYEDGGRPWVAPDDRPVTKKTDAPWFNCELLIRALAQDKPFFIVMVEGEKCAKAFQSCFRWGSEDYAVVLGTYGATWRPLDSHVERLLEILDKIDSGSRTDSEIICWMDNDRPGKDHMEGMIALLHESGYPKPIKLMKAGNRKGYDVVDWLENKQKPNLYELMGKAKTFYPPQYIVDRHPKYGKRVEEPTRETPELSPSPADVFREASVSGPEEAPPPPQVPSRSVGRVPGSDKLHGGKAILSSLDFHGIQEAASSIQAEVRYNTLNEDYELRHRVSDSEPERISVDISDEYTEWLSVDNRVYQKFQASVNQHCVIKAGVDKDGKDTYKRARFGIQLIKDGLDAHVRGNEFNPVVNWLENEIPAWDKRPRLATMLDDMFGCGDGRGPLMDWASLHLLSAVVQRAYSPGYPIPHIVILIGAQGTGKSEFLKQLLPDKYRNEWFNDTFHLDWEPRQQLEGIRGRIVVEIADMAGLRKTENDRLKSFITSSDDGGIRDPYERRPTRTRPRTAILVGTSDRTEEASLPYDPSGYRRFIPVTLAHGCNVQEFMREHRDQLWAEALQYYRQGFDPNELDDFTKKLQAEATKQHAPVNEVIEDKVNDLPQMIADFYNVAVPGAGASFKLADIMKAMGMDERTLMSPSAQRRIGSDLRKLGWKSEKNVRRKNYIREGRSTSGNWWTYPESDD